MIFNRTRRRTEATASSSMDEDARRGLQSIQAVIRNSTEATASASLLRARRIAQCHAEEVSVQDIADALGIQASKVYRILATAPKEVTHPAHWDGTLDPDSSRFTLGNDGETGAPYTLSFPRWQGAVFVDGGTDGEDANPSGRLAFDALLAQAIARPMPWGEGAYPEITCIGRTEALRRFKDRRGVRSELLFSENKGVPDALQAMEGRLQERLHWRKKHYPETADWSEVPDEAKREQGFAPLVLAIPSVHDLMMQTGLARLLSGMASLSAEGLLIFANPGLGSGGMSSFLNEGVGLAWSASHGDMPTHHILFSNEERFTDYPGALSKLGGGGQWAKKTSWGLGKGQALVRSDAEGLGVRPVEVPSFVPDGRVEQGRFMSETLDRLAPREG